MGKHRKTKIMHKSILAVLLSLALLLEPLPGITAVYAEEMQEEIQNGHEEDETGSISDNDSSESKEDEEQDSEGSDETEDRKDEEENDTGDRDKAEESREKDSEEVEDREEDDDIAREDQDSTVSENEID